MMNRRVCSIILLLLFWYAPMVQAQMYRQYNYPGNRSSRSSRSSRSNTPEYPLSSNMMGFFGGVFLTSNPDMSGYDTKKSYTDYGGGLIYDYRYEWSEAAAYEILTSCMLASCNTSHTEQGESKMKVTWPLETRFYLGCSQLKLYFGAGLQYNFIWSWRDNGNDGYYGNSSQDEGTSANQLSANLGAGFCLLGLQSKVHFLIGTKFHFPIVNNAEGTEYSNGNKIDFSKDRESMVLTGGVSLDVSRSCVMMANYDYPLGNSAQTSVNNGESLSFFEQHSQSITFSIMYRF